MPIQISEKNQEAIRFTRKETLSARSTIELWRDAAAKKLDKVVHDAMHSTLSKQESDDGKHYGYVVEGMPTDDKWLRRRAYESDLTYRRRCTFATDPGQSNKVILTYTGIFKQAKTDLETGLSDEQNDIVLQDVDGNGRNFDVQKQAELAELLSVGECWTLTSALPDESGEVSRPFVSIIPREDIMDYDIERGGGFNWVKYRAKIPVLKPGSIERVVKNCIIVWGRENILKFTKVSDDFYKLEDDIPNTLGVVPITAIRMPSSQPIISNIAKYQLDIMNLESEGRDVISIQTLNLLTMPESMKEVSTRIAANSILWYSDEYGQNGGRNAEWVSPPSTTLEPLFTYIARLQARILESAGMVSKDNPRASGESKIMDWAEFEAVLSLACTLIQEATINQLRYWGLWVDEQNEPSYSIDTKFIRSDGAMYLENALKAQLLGVGDTAEQKLREKAVQMLELGLTPDEMEQVRKDIEAIDSDPPETITDHQPLLQDDDDE